MSKTIRDYDNVVPSQILNDFVEYVTQVLYDEMFVRAAENLPPFDGTVQTNFNVVLRDSQLKRLGVVLMKMDMEQKGRFSMGVKTDIETDEKHRDESVTFTTASKSIEELRAYVSDETFKEEVRAICEERQNDAENKHIDYICKRTKVKR